jgi:NAD(P)-dependent dehydrogenase (short-subunit alcohol dehydrogenase family)
MGAARGFDICITCQSDIESAQIVLRECRDMGREAIAHQVDVSDPDAAARVFDDVQDRLGPLSALVNNAGILGPCTAFADLGHDDLRRVFETNVFGYFIYAREAVRRMATDRGGQGGVIVNVSSVVTKFGAPFEYVHYASSKGAVEVMTRGLATEVAGAGIRVNAVRPGFDGHDDVHDQWRYGSYPARGAANTDEARRPTGRDRRSRHLVALGCCQLCYRARSSMSAVVVEMNGLFGRFVLSLKRCAAEAVVHLHQPRQEGHENLTLSSVSGSRIRACAARLG